MRLRQILFSQPLAIGSAIATAVGSLVLVKEYWLTNEYKGKEILTDKVVIVTGANSGIGRHVARLFADREAKVIMACRDLKECEKVRYEIALETVNKYIYCRKCDLASQESIKQFVENFKKEHKELHYLINNAGVMACPKSYTQEGIEQQLGVNFMGPFLLTNLLLDTLKASAPAKILNVSSISFKKGEIKTGDLNSNKKYDPIDAYRQSHLAVTLFTKELDQRLRGSGVTVNAVYPGITYTNITRHMPAHNNIIGKIWTVPMSWIFSQTPKQAANIIFTAALDPAYKDVSGSYFNRLTVDLIDPDRTQEKLCKWMWQVGEVWTRLNTAQLNK